MAQNDYVMVFQICYFKNLLFQQGFFFVSLFSLLLLNSPVWDYFQLTIEIVDLYSAVWGIFFFHWNVHFVWPLIVIRDIKQSHLPSLNTVLLFGAVARDQ